MCHILPLSRMNKNNIVYWKGREIQIFCSGARYDTFCWLWDQFKTPSEINPPLWYISSQIFEHICYKKFWVCIITIIKYFNWYFKRIFYEILDIGILWEFRSVNQRTPPIVERWSKTNMHFEGGNIWHMVPKYDLSEP